MLVEVVLNRFVVARVLLNDVGQDVQGVTLVVVVMPIEAPQQAVVPVDDVGSAGQETDLRPVALIKVLHHSVAERDDSLPRATSIFAMDEFPRSDGVPIELAFVGALPSVMLLRTRLSHK